MASSSVEANSYDREGFNRALFVWIQKPQVLNRRLCGNKTICQFEMLLTSPVSEIFNKRHHLVQLVKIDSTEEHIKNTMKNCFHKSEIDENSMKVILRDLMPKEMERYRTVRELIVIGMNTFF